MRLLEFMWTKFFSSFSIILFASISFYSCSGSDLDDPKLEIEVVKETKSSKGKLYHPSELALLMRKMYDNMKAVGVQLKAGGTVSDSLLIGYETIVSAKATNPDEIDGKFYGFANMWVSEVSLMQENPTLENYNNIMTSCVNCHKSYCPGPIPKIKKLRLVP